MRNLRLSIYRFWICVSVGVLTFDIFLVYFTGLRTVFVHRGRYKLQYYKDISGKLFPE